MELTLSSADQFASQFLANLKESHEYGSGRGIVTCAGGIKYNTCAWVLIKLLRRLGCDLPIEVWYLGPRERDRQWIELVEPLGVTCIDAYEVAKRHPHRKLQGWPLKPYAILHSRFREVLFLDADNVPVRDPSFLFEAPEYQETGTVFWPDPEKFRTLPESPLWDIFGLAYRESPDQESGQLLVDKSRCLEALQLCNWYNEHADFYYQHVYGDKETFSRSAGFQHTQARKCVSRSCSTILMGRYSSSIASTTSGRCFRIIRAPKASSFMTSALNS
jgi:hypothetical protein